MRHPLSACVYVLFCATASAQSVVSTHPPLSPEEAVRVLRGSHSIADLTDYRGAATGPTIVVMGSSTTPWDWPAAAYTQPRPLASDYPFFAPHYAPRYAPRYESAFFVGSRVRQDHASRDVVERPAPPRAVTPGRHIEMSAAPSAGRAVRRR